MICERNVSHKCIFLDNNIRKPDDTSDKESDMIDKVRTCFGKDQIGNAW